MTDILKRSVSFENCDHVLTASLTGGPCCTEAHGDDEAALTEMTEVRRR